MKLKNRYTQIEIFLYISILLISLFVHIFLNYDTNRKMLSLIFEIIKFAPFVFIFLINNYLLVNKLLFKKRYGLYIISCVLVVVISLYLNDLWWKSDFSPHKQKPSKELLLKELQSDNNKNELFDAKKKFPPPAFYFNLFLFCFSLIGFNTGVKIFIRAKKEEEEKETKEKHYLSTELAFLRHQISPHFFMNTLNNIHALVDINSEKAKESIVKLSQLMRYMLYETDNDKVPLSKEIEFINSYIELMRIKYDESKVEIKTLYPTNIQSVYVPSLLFLPFIENAFKHGISIKYKSWIEINFYIDFQTIVLNLKNSNHPDKNNKNFIEKSGIGLDNIKKRLTILYKNEFDLQINTTETVFDVTLKIPSV